MNEQQYLDFLFALGQEFCSALKPSVSDVIPQEGYEVFLRAFNQEPSPGFLASLSETELEHLRSECQRYFESPEISLSQVRLAVERTLRRWPVED